MAHRPGNHIPVSREYTPNRTFGNNSLNNLLIFMEPCDVESKLGLIEVYLLLNDFNSVENLIEQVYDDIKHIGQFVQPVEPEQEKDGENKSEDEKEGSPSSDSAPLDPIPPTPSSSEIQRVPISCTKEELEERVLALRTMLKANSQLVRTLKTSAYAVNTIGEGTGVDLPRPEKPLTMEERAAVKKLRQEQRRNKYQ